MLVVVFDESSNLPFSAPLGCLYLSVPCRAVLQDLCVVFVAALGPLSFQSVAQCASGTLCLWCAAERNCQRVAQGVDSSILCLARGSFVAQMLSKIWMLNEES